MKINENKIFVFVKGTCINNIESYACLCPIGWTGSLCEVNINECSFPLSCHPNSTCIDLPGSYQCICPPWLTGVNCLTAIDQCLTYPCLNNGVCVNNYGSSPTCHCQPGFTGVYCEVRASWNSWFSLRKMQCVLGFCRSILMIVKQHLVIIMEYVLIKQIVFYVYVHQVIQV